MSEGRCVKGVIVVAAVKALRAVQRASPAVVDGLSASAKELAEQRVLPSGWYPVAPYMEVIEAVAKTMYRTDKNPGFAMGLAAGRGMINTPHGNFVRRGDCARTVKHFPLLWVSQYNFGTPAVLVRDNHAELEIDGFEEMTELYSQIIVGALAGMLKEAGAQSCQSNVLEGPWKGDASFRASFNWA